MSKYINPYTDFGFKKLFGTELNKDLLISFLNALFEKSNELPKDEIEDITYLSAEKLGRSASERRAIFDVYCTTKSGAKFIVEMQNVFQQFFKDRSVYYSSFPIQEMAKKDSSTGKVFYRKLAYLYLEMPKFNKTESQLVTMYDKWLFALKNLSKLLERPKELQERVFEKLFRQAEIAMFTPEEYTAYEESLHSLWDITNAMNDAEAKGYGKGYDKGVENGRAEGEHNALLATARRMKSKGYSADMIADITGLTPSEIEKL